MTIVTVTTAHPLTKEQLKTVQELVEKKVGKAKIEQQIDPDLLGGLRLTIGNQEFDASLSGRLEKLEARLDIATVVSAIPLTDKQRQSIKSALQEKYGELELEEVVDPSVIGGVSLTVGSKQFDSTVKGKLQTLQQQLLQAI